MPHSPYKIRKICKFRRGVRLTNKILDTPGIHNNVKDSWRTYFIISTLCAIVLSFFIVGITDNCGWWWKPWTVWWTGPILPFGTASLADIESFECTPLPFGAAELIRSRIASDHLANVFWSVEHARMRLGAIAFPAVATGYTSFCAFAWHRNKSRDDTKIIAVNPVILDSSHDTVMVNEVGAWTTEWNGERSRASWIVAQWLEINASRVFCNPGELSHGPQTYLPPGLIARTMVQLDGQDAFVFQSMVEKIHPPDK